MMPPLTAEEKVWYLKLAKRFPRAKAHNLRYNARRLARGVPALMLRGRPALAGKDGLPDGTATWWPRMKAHKEKPEIKPEDL